MKDLEIVFDPLPPAALREFITYRLGMFNVARTGFDEWHPIGFFLKSGQGEWLGGLLGDTWGGWMNVRFVWLAEVVRGQRYGTRLMDAAEAYAASRGCIAATLDTHSYEALGFYQKRGYEVFGQLEDCPPGHTKYYLRKRLAQS
ncbi:MAG: GNAT family N-acetyltransferase [Acetobacteraceae bacterium]|jgi:GNAT superfamily N-acetyltransferase